MIRFTDYIDPLAFFIAFGIGLLITYATSKPRKLIIQWPTPENAGQIVYKSSSESCYTYKANEVNCPEDKTKINKTEIN